MFPSHDPGGAAVGGTMKSIWNWIKNKKARGLSKWKRRRNQRGFTRRVRAIARGILENKHIEVSLASGTWYAGNSLITSISDQVTQGDNENQRDGDTIHPTSLAIRAHITSNATATSDTIVRMIIIRWKEDMTASHTLPTMTDILNTDAIDEFGNWDNSSNYTKLLDKEIVLPLRTNGASVAQVNKPIRYYKKFKMKTPKCTYDGAGSGNGRKNHYFLILMSNQPSPKQPSIDGIIRFTFKD